MIVVFIEYHSWFNKKKVKKHNVFSLLIKIIVFVVSSLFGIFRIEYLIMMIVKSCVSLCRCTCRLIVYINLKNE